MLSLKKMTPFLLCLVKGNIRTKDITENESEQKKLNSGLHTVTLMSTKVSETEKLVVGLTEDTK